MDHHHVVFVAFSKADDQVKNEEISILVYLGTASVIKNGALSSRY